MNSYGEYMIYLLHAPFKKVKREYNNWKLLMRIFGKHFEELKGYIFLIREETSIETAEKALDLIGKGMRMIRYQNETNEQYRKRLLAKRRIAEMAGTKNSILYALKSLGYEDAEVLPVPLTSIQQNKWNGRIRWNGNDKWSSSSRNEEHWSEFMVILSTENPGSLNNFEILKQEILKIKQASSLPVYKFKTIENIEFGTSLSLEQVQVKTEVEFLEQIEHRASVSLEAELQFQEECIVQGHIDGVQKWNGVHKFDGKREWKSEVIEMEL